jgi:hypothetical protein
LRILASLLKVRVTLAYVVLASVAAIAMSHLGPRSQWHVLHEASTNLHNLSDGHIATLITSAFLTDGEPNWAWLACVAALFAVAEWVSGSRRFTLTFVAGHVGATAIVAVGLFVGIHADWLADSLAMTVDVGVSYAAAAVAGSMIRYLPGVWRVLWGAGWIGVVSAAAISDPSFTAFGHTAALFIGFAVGCVYLRVDGKPLFANNSRPEQIERVHPTPSMTSL